MAHQRGELNAPSWGSRIKSAFTGSGNDARLKDLERKVETLMIIFNRLDAAVQGAVSDIHELKALRPKVAELEARIAELETQNAGLQGAVDERAIKIEEARAGSLGNV